MIKQLLSMAVLCAVATVSYGAGDPVAGKAKSALCIGCHGADGNSSNPDWPSLAGQHEGYLAKQISDFKTQKRIDGTMNAMVLSLSDADIANVAAFFASNKIKGGAASEESLELGQKIYRGGIAKRGVAACASCHGPAGKGNPAANFPAVGGQHAKYTEKTLNDFRLGTRKNDPGNMMGGVAGKMKESEIKAVADYLAGLK